MQVRLLTGDWVFLFFLSLSGVAEYCHHLQTGPGQATTCIGCRAVQVGRGKLSWPIPKLLLGGLAPS